MTLAEYLFQIEKCTEITEASYGVYDFWSIDDQSIYYFFNRKFDFSENFVELLCGIDLYEDEMLFINWQTLQPLFNISISDPADFPEKEPLMRNQLIVIRGTCSGQCPGKFIPRYGYVARMLPSCEPVSRITDDGKLLCSLRDDDFEVCGLKADGNVKIGTALWSQKFATFRDMLFDAVYWANCCKCVDAVIFNLDTDPQVNRPETDGAYAAIHIKDGKLKVVTGSALEKLYHKYCRYPAVDYDIEKSLSRECGFCFKFERGTSGV